jgi:F-type H+-transporting ATPase subunit gamma
MRKSELSALSARPYAISALEILRNLVGKNADLDTEIHSFMKKREIKNTLLIVVTSDKGLAGSFNSNVLRKAEIYRVGNPNSVSIVTVGKKGKNFYTRKVVSIVAEFYDAGDFTTVDETLPIAKFASEFYESGKCDEVVIIYTNFISALKQDVNVRKLLPFTKDSLEDIVEGIVPISGKYSKIPKSFTGIRDSAKNSEYIYEPGKSAVLDTLLPTLFNIEIHHSILEANASEHSARMVAMKSASDNARDLQAELLIRYNKARQAQITKELIEITAGREALRV